MKKSFKPTLCGWFLRFMKNLQKNWIVAVAIVVLALIGGYFVSTNIGQQTASTPTTTSQEQVKKAQVEVKVDYAGDSGKSAEIRSVEVEEGKTAWDALQTAVGKENIEFKDYGGDLGIFIAGINGVKPTGNKFWLVKVNGEGAKVGASTYKVKSGDQIEFVVSEASEGQ